MSVPKRERGAVLIISLILLVLITLIGVASLRNVVLEAKMSSNYYDRSLAFQSAEAGLRAGEKIAKDQAEATPKHTQALALTVPTDASQCNASTACSGGLCSAPGPYCEGRWTMTDATWTNATAVTLNAQAGSSPQYFVEFLGNAFPCDPSTPTVNATCARYRITARSQSGTGRAAVMLQSVYATE
ncbi:pilus assembly PilX family protein [Hydrogenophaga taeniospiralis]|nr:PilX N-terminal domain-containing pilus assembly protein [Hydrogenophaga taeniospiralis]